MFVQYFASFSGVCAIPITLWLLHNNTKSSPPHMGLCGIPITAPMLNRPLSLDSSLPNYTTTGISPDKGHLEDKPQKVQEPSKEHTFSRPREETIGRRQKQVY